MKILKWLSKAKLSSPMHAIPGDTIELAIDDKVLVKETISKTVKVDEVRIFEAEVDGKYSFGGIFMGKVIKNGEMGKFAGFKVAPKKLFKNLFNKKK